LAKRFQIALLLDLVAGVFGPIHDLIVAKFSTNGEYQLSKPGIAALWLCRMNVTVLLVAIAFWTVIRNPPGLK
jgi:hypothetical protein